MGDAELALEALTLGLMGLCNAVNLIAFCIGLFFIFKKCGVRKFWAFIPGFRNYKLAECADMKDDGTVWFYASFADFLLEAFTYFIDLQKIVSGSDKSLVDSNVMQMVDVLRFIFAIVAVIYAIRVYLGLTKLFHKRKRWVFLWIFFDGITAMIWGLSKKFQPEYRIVDKYKEYIYGENVKELSEGLTINIKDRTVGKGMRKKYLLRDIHMNIKPGRMVLLLGGSGAGKTTFINAVTGYEKADAKIILNGQDVYKEFDHMKYEIGFVPQQDLIRYSDTVYHTLDDAAYLRLPKSVDRKEREKRVEQVMDIMGLAPVKDNLVVKQSGGQKKRISIATEFISDPSLYVLDEPDSGLDGILAKDLMRRLHDISRMGKTVIVITHSPDRVLDCFDDVIVLAKDENHVGRLVYYGPVDEAKEFFHKDSMEEIVKTINRKEEGGEGMADELIEKFIQKGKLATE